MRILLFYVFAYAAVLCTVMLKTMGTAGRLTLLPSVVLANQTTDIYM